MVVRGHVLRQLFILRVLAVERGVRGVLLIGIGYGILQLSNREASLRQLFDSKLPLATPLADAFGYNLAQSPVVATIHNIFTIRSSTLAWVGVAVLAYAALQLLEAVGLWLSRRWGEYLTVVATSVFLPLEIYELTERVTTVRIGAFIINVAAVIYLIVAKRLFGVRGGAAAVDRERRSMSLLEVEQAAGKSEPATVSGPLT